MLSKVECDEAKDGKGSESFVIMASMSEMISLREEERRLEEKKFWLKTVGKKF